MKPAETGALAATSGVETHEDVAAHLLAGAGVQT
jgi:hypothetical protein